MNDWKELAQGVGLFWMRLLMGAGIAYHGYGKIFGGHLPMLTEGVAKLGFPAPGFFAWAAALSEFAGGIAVILGIATRPAALLIFATMSVAAFMQHAADPFQVKELALAYWAMAGTLALTGPGPFSLDHQLFGRKTDSF